MVVGVDCHTDEGPCVDLPTAHGFEVDEAEVVVWGYCPTCLTPSTEFENP